MKIVNKNNLETRTNNIYNWVKNKIYQILGFIFIIFSFYLYFALYYFDFQNYGNPYASLPKENIGSFFIVSSWINGVLTYWTGLVSWIIPITSLIIGYKIINMEKIKNIFIKFLFIFIGIILICGALKNLGQDGGQLSLITYRLFIWAEQFIKTENKALIINILAVLIGLSFFLVSLDYSIHLYKIHKY